ncbi:MAG TPA: class I SAM-dependent methyltransferase [Usitatibacteraceae bacterium]|nr:class I SAM-dependent methyltransferase [Usitatibacteraceae bacterium]
MAAPTAYDEIAYPGWPYPQTHPDRLATLGTLFGMSPADPASCRVLELGCGDGANLLPIACASRGARLVGIDLAESAVARGRAIAGELGLQNLDLRSGDISRLPADLGEFDYVIAHGVYSWVPEPVRRALLEACRRHLAPQGIAFVSYNVQPGGHLRSMLREMLLMHAEGIDDPGERCAAARAFLALIAEARPVEETSGTPSALALEAQRLSGRSDGGLFHDDLSPVFHLCYFRDFCDEAEANGLQFLAEAQFHEMQDLGLPAPARERLAGFAPDLVSREQYLDFVKERRFRQTLLCRSEVALRSEVRGETAAAMSVSSQARPEGEAEDPLAEGERHYRGRGGGTVSTDRPLVKVALDILAREWPRALPVDDLLAAAAARCGRTAGPAERAMLGDFALACYAAGCAQLHQRQPAFSRWPGPKPQASALARLQARAGLSVTGVPGNIVALDDALARRLVVLLDGTRDRAALLRDIRGDAAAMAGLKKAAGEKGDASSLTAALERSLDALGRCALLLAEAPPACGAGRSRSSAA